MAKNNGSAEERTSKVLNALFVMQAAQLGISGAEIRKILGIAMNDVSPTLKVVNKALRNREKAASEGR
jgi:hypothetical protein